MVIKYGLIQDTELWGRIGSHGWFCQSILEHAESIISILAWSSETMLWQMSWTMVFDCISNFGHTIGHAIEATAGYGQVMHGEAVSMGMVQLPELQKKKLDAKGITQKNRRNVPEI